MTSRHPEYWAAIMFVGIGVALLGGGILIGWWLVRAIEWWV